MSEQAGPRLPETGPVPMETGRSVTPGQDCRNIKDYKHTNYCLFYKYTSLYTSQIIFIPTQVYCWLIIINSLAYCLYGKYTSVLPVW